MGTNYYIRKPACSCCGHQEEGLHIGKSSAGWCFSLHVTEDIRSLEDWQKEWSKPGVGIFNEYDEPVTPDEMMSYITARAWPAALGSKWSYAEYDQNSAEPGPNGLARHRIDGRHCVGHGEGTWDLIKGEFS